MKILYKISSSTNSEIKMYAWFVLKRLWYLSSQTIDSDIQEVFTILERITSIERVIDMQNKNVKNVHGDFSSLYLKIGWLIYFHFDTDVFLLLQNYLGAISTSIKQASCKQFSTI